jgi:hypothetical protein
MIEDSAIRNLKDIVGFGETLCALTEMKENDYNEMSKNNVDITMNGGIANVWNILIDLACEFETRHIDTDWEVDEWFETLEAFYRDEVRKQVFILQDL